VTFRQKSWLVRGLFTIFLLAFAYHLAGNRVSLPLATAFLAGFSAHLIWDIFVIPLAFSLGWYAKSRRECHSDHRSICCQNPKHGGP
jgi:hypothetical protein